MRKGLLECRSPLSTSSMLSQSFKARSAKGEEVIEDEEL